MADEGLWVLAAPIFLSRDLQVSENFYVQFLDFTLDSRYDNYLIVSRDQVELHLALAPTLDPLTNSCQAYIRVEGIEALYEQYRAYNVIHPNGALQIHPWGMKEFAVLDPDHNLLKFGEDAEAG